MRLKQIAKGLQRIRLCRLPYRRNRERAATTEEAQKLVRRLRKFTKLPIAVGFGISTPDQYAAVGKFADAVVDRQRNR